MAKQSGPRGSRAPRPALPERRGPGTALPALPAPSGGTHWCNWEGTALRADFSCRQSHFKSNPDGLRQGCPVLPVSAGDTNFSPSRSVGEFAVFGLPGCRGTGSHWIPTFLAVRLAAGSSRVYLGAFPVDRPFAAEIGKCPHPGARSCVTLKRCRWLFLKYSISSVAHLPGQSAASCPSSKAALGRQLGGDQGGESPPLGSPAASCRAAAQAGPPAPPALGPAGSGLPAIGAAEQKNLRGGQAQQQNQHQPRSQPAHTSGVQHARAGAARPPCPW